MFYHHFYPIIRVISEWDVNKSSFKKEMRLKEKKKNGKF